MLEHCVMAGLVSCMASDCPGDHFFLLPTASRAFALVQTFLKLPAFRMPPLSSTGDTAEL